MVRHIAAWFSAAAFLFAPLSEALPISVTPASGQHGELVLLSLVDASTDELESATIEILFNSQHLRFTGASLGTLISHPDRNFNLVLTDSAAGAGKVVVSLAGGSAAVDMESGELLRVSFEILARAPLGEIEVLFQCQNPTATGANSCATDYNIPATGGIGVVTVLAPSASAPAASSLMLLALGLVVLRAVRRKG